MCIGVWKRGTLCRVGTMWLVMKEILVEACR
jgi:hypothetical protein